jgi:hypothetical protein
MADGSRSILIRRAKNDPFADGRLGMLSPATLAHVNRNHPIDTAFISTSVHLN